jgi:hypothetical protein
MSDRILALVLNELLAQTYLLTDPKSNNSCALVLTIVY